MIYNPQDGAFRTKHGPIFSNLILADEINRAPAKVQSALLEAMQERQVTIGEETYSLPNPFLVLATQNPLEQEGTYPLPEAQIDRFMMKVIVTYPNRAEERAILDAMATTEPMLVPRPWSARSRSLRPAMSSIPCTSTTRSATTSSIMVLATRPPMAASLNLNGYIQNGASPRATIALTLAARAMAFLNGRHFVIPQDVKIDRPGCAASPRHRHLRGRGRKCLLGERDRQNLEHAAGALSMASDETIKSIPGIMGSMRRLEIRTRRMVNDSLAGRVSFGVQGPRHGFRGGARIHARR